MKSVWWCDLVLFYVVVAVSGYSATFISDGDIVIGDGSLAALAVAITAESHAPPDFGGQQPSSREFATIVCEPANDCRWLQLGNESWKMLGALRMFCCPSCGFLQHHRE